MNLKTVLTRIALASVMLLFVGITIIGQPLMAFAEELPGQASTNQSIVQPAPEQPNPRQQQGQQFAQLRQDISKDMQQRRQELQTQRQELQAQRQSLQAEVRQGYEQLGTQFRQAGKQIGGQFRQLQVGDRNNG